MRAELASAVRHVAASDCEAIGHHLVAQPANTLSSLAYVLVGGLLLARSRRVAPPSRRRARAVAAALVAVGAGSVAFHGPGGPTAHWLHDASIVALALAAVLPAHAPAAAGRATWALAAAATAAGLVLALVPSAGNAVALPALAAAVVVGARTRTGSLANGVTGLVLLAGGLALGALSRSGQPLCEPATLLQGHAAWHLLSAAGLGLLATGLDAAPAEAAGHRSAPVPSPA